jgi:hypothetical protein
VKTVHKPVQQISKAPEKVILVLRINRPTALFYDASTLEIMFSYQKGRIQNGITNAGEDSVQPESGVQKPQKLQSLKAIRGVCHVDHPFPQDVSLDFHGIKDAEAASFQSL